LKKLEEELEDALAREATQPHAEVDGSDVSDG
jgi:hypothetical protein